MAGKLDGRDLARASPAESAGDEEPRAPMSATAISAMIARHEQRRDALKGA
jgi:hypothetical protein